MCLLLHIPPGLALSSVFDAAAIERVSDANPHGWGMSAWDATTKTTHTHKANRQLPDTILSRIDSPENIARTRFIHWRFGTSGTNTLKYNHPFEVVPNVMLAHNGVIDGLGDHSHSDTYYLAQMLRTIYTSHNKRKHMHRLKDKLLAQFTIGNRFLIMDHGEVTLWGDWLMGNKNPQYKGISASRPIDNYLNPTPCSTGYGKYFSQGCDLDSLDDANWQARVYRNYNTQPSLPPTPTTTNTGTIGTTPAITPPFTPNPHDKRVTKGERNARRYWADWCRKQHQTTQLILTPTSPPNPAPLTLDPTPSPTLKATNLLKPTPSLFPDPDTTGKDAWEKEMEIALSETHPYPTRTEILDTLAAENRDYGMDAFC